MLRVAFVLRSTEAHPVFFGLLPISLKALCYWGPFSAARFFLTVFQAGELIMVLGVVMVLGSIIGIAVGAL